MERAAEAALRRRLDALGALGEEARALQLELVEALAAATEAGAPPPSPQAPSLWARLFGGPAAEPPSPTQSPQARLREAWAAVMTRLRRLSQHAELLEAEVALINQESPEDDGLDGVGALLCRALEDQAALQREARPPRPSTRRRLSPRRRPPPPPPMVAAASCAARVRSRSPAAPPARSPLVGVLLHLMTGTTPSKVATTAMRTTTSSTTAP